MAEDSKIPEKALPEEIKELEQMLEDKKRVLAERGEEREHKEVFKEAFLEKYKEVKPPVLPHAIPPSGVFPGGKIQDMTRIKTEEKLHALIGLAFEKGVRSAIGLKGAACW